MKYVLTYETAADFREKVPLHLAAHRRRWAEFHQRGLLLMVGPFTDALGAMGIFASRQAAEEFATDDPFVHGGVVRSWSIREWAEALVPE